MVYPLVIGGGEKGRRGPWDTGEVRISINPDPTTRFIAPKVGQTPVRADGGNKRFKE